MQRLVVIDARNARLGGGLTYLLELVPRLEKELARHGTQVTVLAGPPRNLKDRIQRRIRLGQASAILHVGNRATFAPTARQIVCIRDRTLVANERIRSSWPIRFRIRRVLVWAAIFVCDVLVVPSSSMVGPVNATSRLIPRRRKPPVLVIPHGRPSWTAPHARPLGNPIRLLFPSHVTDHKNFSLLAKVLDAARTALAVPIRLTLTASADELYRRRPMRDWFSRSLLQVDFAGHVDRSNLPELYKSHDILVFPSLVEAFGFPLIEAMTMGMPIVASDRSWAREVCGTTAYYADPHDPNDWVRALSLCSEEGIRQNPDGLERVRAFDWDHAAAAYAQLLVTPQ
jgi:glycosyltransferase involved in cell wall biosynthesis